jgi:iron-sulfur cluster insertion protein
VITITTEAAKKIKTIIDEEDPSLKLRVFVQGGGCIGMSYGFTFDEIQNEDDFEFEKDSVKFLVDSMSYQYLTDSTIDYKEELMGSNFVITNPNAQTTCGCGSSFSV